jgi:hypothetical protein
LLALAVDLETRDQQSSVHLDNVIGTGAPSPLCNRP